MFAAEQNTGGGLTSDDCHENGGCESSMKVSDSVNISEVIEFLVPCYCATMFLIGFFLIGNSVAAPVAMIVILSAGLLSPFLFVVVACFVYRIAGK